MVYWIFILGSPLISALVFPLTQNELKQDVFLIIYYDDKRLKVNHQQGNYDVFCICYSCCSLHNWHILIRHQASLIWIYSQVKSSIKKVIELIKVFLTSAPDEEVFRNKFIILMLESEHLALYLSLNISIMWKTSNSHCSGFQVFA